jgi:cytochrome c-type biogenesis protein CcmH/NrfG
MSDAETWMELCELYIKEQDFAKAAFCCEELILQNPNNHIYFQRYAEIRYTQGGFENMEMAKTYYSKSVTLNPQNMRALYGLLLVRERMQCMGGQHERRLD